MRRSLLGLVVVAVLSACSDSPVTSTTSPGISLANSTPADGVLDQAIYDLIDQWPDGPSDAILSQWITVKRKFAEGNQQLTDKMFFQLASLVLKKTDEMNDPPGDETESAAAARLLSYMSLFLGGETDVPPAGSDNIAGLLTPDAPLTLVTPGGWAGVHFDEGSVNEDRVVVITENPVQYGPCDGPLLTELCQYPLYYDIASYPDGPLLKVAQAQVCHPPVGAEGGPPDEATHNRLRLAHPKPASSDDYVTGGTIRDTPASAENIEILPLISQTFLPSCEDVEYQFPEEITSRNFLERGIHLASRLASRVGRFLTPKSAYAIDQGGGGGFVDFGSPFNNVDPCSGETPEPSCFPEID